MKLYLHDICFMVDKAVEILSLGSIHKDNINRQDEPSFS